MNENNGQISGEYLLLVGVLILTIIMGLSFIGMENEMDIAMESARNGVGEGASMSSSGIYVKDSFESNYNLILHPYSVDIINISYSEMGHDSNYDKEKIQFKVYAKASQEFSKKELDSIGDRINYNLRKSLAMGFNTTSATNKLYNPVFSPHYVFTTANVKWV